MSSRPPTRAGRDLWSLHVPLVAALLISGTATWVELTRALEGVGIAWVYVIQWPMIGAFCVWMWVRLRRERDAADHAGMPPGATSSGGPPRPVTPPAEEEAAADPDLVAWREYQARVRRANSGG